MADPFNLTIDESVFDDANNEIPSLIDEPLTLEQNVFQVCQELENLNSAGSNVRQLETRIQKILFRGDQDLSDVRPIVRLVCRVSEKLRFLSAETGRAAVEMCRQVFVKVAQDHTEEIKPCFEAITACLGHVSLNGSCVESLIAALHVVEKSFVITHQNNQLSEMIQQLSTDLLMLAVKILEQQVAFDQMNLLNLLNLLMKIGQTTFKSVNTMAAVWKQVVKLVKQNPDVCPSLDLRMSVRHLVQETKLLLDHFKSGKNLVKLIKATGFLLKIITTFLDTQVNLCDEEKEAELIANLILELERFTPDFVKYELNLPDDMISLIESQISVAIHVLLNHLVATRHFLVSVKTVSSSVPGVNQIHLCRLLALTMTPFYQTALNPITEMHHLLEVFLSTIDQAHVELSGSLMLNGIMNCQQSAQPVAAYELLLVQICSGVAITEPSKIPLCVVTLLNSVVSKGFWACLIASDVLCFMARYGTSQFCQELVLGIFQLARSNQRLLSLLNRLVPLLSPAGRKALLKSHPLEQHPDIWASLSWASFPNEQQTLFADYYVQSAQQHPKAATILHLNSLCSSNSSVLKGRTNWVPILLDLLTQMRSLHGKMGENYRLHLEHLTAYVLRILFHIVQPDHEQEQVAQLLKEAKEHCNISTVQLNSANYLRSLATTTISSSRHQQSILRGISSLYSVLLGSSSFVVQTATLRSFEVFAKLTPHTDVIPSCVNAEQQSIVASFVKRNPTRRPPPDCARFLRSQLATISMPEPNMCSLIPKLGPATDFGNDPISNGLVSFKRPRLDKEGDEQLQFLLKNLDNLVKSFQHHQPLPLWAKDEIREKIRFLDASM